MSGRDFVVLGCSHWHAPWYVRALEAAGQRISGVSDPSARAVGTLSQGRTVTRHVDWRSLLDEHPDAIPLVLTPPSLTPPVLERVIAERRPLVLEKPGTVSASVLAPLVHAASYRGVPSLVPLVNRLSEFWAEADVSGLMTTWTHAHLRILAGPPQRYLRDDVAWVLDPAVSGGGALRNLGVHAADAVVQLVKATDPSLTAWEAASRLRILSAVTTSMHGVDVEDFAVATLQAEDGRTVTIEAGYAMPSETATDKEWRLHGLRGAVAESNGTLSVRSASGTRRRPAMASGEQYLMFGRLLAALAEGEQAQDAPGLEDLAAALHLVDRIYAAATGTHDDRTIRRAKELTWDGTEGRQGRRADA